MLNRTPQIKLKDSFEADTFDWFSGRSGHMERWQYLEPRYEGDPVRGSKLWNIWESAAGDDNMLKRQGRIIAEQAADMVALTKPCHTLVDLGPGGMNAVIRNTVPFIEQYGEDLSTYIAVDVSMEATSSSKNYIENLKSGLMCHAVHDDFLKSGLSLPTDRKTVALFMGGTIGNIEAEQNTRNALSLMASRIRQLKQNLPVGTVIFIGLEATQSGSILFGDYDHPRHAEFEMNIMHGIKRDILSREKGFNPDAWKYSMAWWPDSYQFCHLAEATHKQKFSMRGKEFEFEKGTQLVIDNSFKFPILAMQRSAQIAGTKYLRPFLDNEGRMVIHALKLCGG